METHPSTVRFLVPEGRRLPDLLSALGRAGYGAGTRTAARYVGLFVDSQDGRLGREGDRLCLRTADGVTLWHLDAAAGEEWAAFAGDVGARAFDPASGLPSPAAERAAGRLLLPLLRLRVASSEGPLNGPAGVRFDLRWESFSAGPTAGPLPTVRATRRLLTARLAEGDSVELLHLAAYLRDRLGLTAERRDAVSLGLGDLRLPEPGAPVPPEMRVLAGDALAVAGRKIVAQQAWRMRANTAGTLEDVDPEYLHDLRVATRRLRSGLRLLGPVLGTRRALSLRIELGWIGRLLGAVRDLDVFILNLRAQSERLGESGRIAEILAAELAARRLPEREALDGALRSRRFARLLERLEALASSPSPRRPRGAPGEPVRSAGPALMARAQKRVLRLGRTVGPSSPHQDLHRLRILIKRLRYTCEFFREAFVEEAGAAGLAEYIRALVSFQDCLGEHQDAVVAMRRVEELAREMVGAGTLGPERLMDLGALVQVQREIAADRRGKLARLWARFDRPSVRWALRDLGAGDAEAGPAETSEKGAP